MELVFGKQVAFDTKRLKLKPITLIPLLYWFRCYVQRSLLFQNQATRRDSFFFKSFGRKIALIGLSSSSQTASWHRIRQLGFGLADLDRSSKSFGFHQNDSWIPIPFET